MIARGRESVDFEHALTTQDKFVVQTNMDVWLDEVHDARYNKAVSLMN